MNRHVQRGLALAVLLTVVAATWFVRIDDIAQSRVEDGFKRALATFAAARALNAVISVAQGTELAIQPAGVGLSFAPGQVLNPINELVEQFSTLMLVATSAFGVQRVLISIGGWFPVSVALTAVAAAWALMRWRNAAPMPWLSKVLVALVMVRFLVPAVTLGSDVLFERFLQADYHAAEQTLEASSDEIGRLSRAEAAAPAAESFLDRMQRLAKQGIDIGAKFDALKTAANRTVEHVVRLIVVFLLQTLLLPLLLGWAFWQVARSVLAGRAQS